MAAARPTFLRFALLAAAAASLACGTPVFGPANGGGSGGQSGGGSGGGSGGSSGGGSGGSSGGGSGGSNGGGSGGSNGGGSGGGTASTEKLCITAQNNLQFGTLGEGGTASLSLTITNCGNTDLVIDQFALAATAPTTTQFTYSAGTLPAVGQTMLAGASTQGQITYTAGAPESDAAQINYTVVHGTDAIEDSIQMSGASVPASCGSTRANPTVNIVTSTGSSASGPFTTFNPATTSATLGAYLVLDGAGSTVASGATTYKWSLISGPLGTTTGTIAADSSIEEQPTISGDYLFALTISDVDSCSSTAEVNINVAAPAVTASQLRIVLTWPEPCGDLDVLYIPPGAAACDPVQCYGGNLTPDWGCTTEGCGVEQDPGGQYPDGIANDDPILDHDARWGGEETIVHEAPFDSAAATPYQIWIAYASSVPDGGGGTGTCGTTHPSVSIFVGGLLRNTFTLTAGLTDTEIWNPANIAVSNAGATVTVVPESTTAADLQTICPGA